MPETFVIHTGELRVGMYVILTSWNDRPTLKNEFLIESKDQIKQIVESGFRNVRVDPARSTSPEAAILARKHGDPDGNQEHMLAHFHTGEVVLPDFRMMLTDKSMAPAVKAAEVKKHSLSMMKKLEENPTDENIRAVKSGIYKIVDVILDEDETANELINQADHNNYSHTHSVNVGMLSIMLAKRVLDRDAHDFHELGTGFFLHDIGKVRVDQSIVNKRGRLNKGEMDQMKKHPELGFQMLNTARQLTEECSNIVLQHHERVDGKGYPQGLAKEDIHLYARICSIADVYDAMTSMRSYRKRLKPFDALIVMRKEMLGHIQKDIFEHLVYMLHGSIREQ